MIGGGRGGEASRASEVHSEVVFCPAVELFVPD